MNLVINHKCVCKNSPGYTRSINMLYFSPIIFTIKSPSFSPAPFCSRRQEQLKIRLSSVENQSFGCLSLQMPDAGEDQDGNMLVYKEIVQWDYYQSEDQGRKERKLTCYSELAVALPPDWDSEACASPSSGYRDSWEKSTDTVTQAHFTLSLQQTLHFTLSLHQTLHCHTSKLYTVTTANFTLSLKQTLHYKFRLYTCHSKLPIALPPEARATPTQGCR